MAMRWWLEAPLLALAGVGVVALSVRFSPTEVQGIRQPPPTEHLLDEDAEKVNKTARKAWFRERHKAPPGVDWRELERANGLAQIAKRNTLADAPPVLPAADDEPLPVWVERGSVNLAGRMHVTQHSPDGRVIYCGSSLGGLWKKVPERPGWVPIGDNLYGGVHWLAVMAPQNPGDPDVVLTSTDWGGLVHRSEDDGQTWTTPTGLGYVWNVRRVLTLTDGSDTVFVLKNNGSAVKLFRSTDRGQSFSPVRDLGGYEGDVWAPRDGGGTLYLLADDGVWTSPDRGDSWVHIGPRPGDSGSAELTGSEAGGPRLYAVLDEVELWRSDDAGRSWQYLHPVEDYWRSLNASVRDPDLFIWGGVEAHVTRDGGHNFHIINGWGDYYGDPLRRLHADIPGIDLVLDEHGREIWYIATDGGLYHSLDGLHNVRNLSMTGLRVSQYYSTLTSSANPDHIAGGSQDQGYQIAITSTDEDELVAFEQIISGDYGHLTSGDGTHGYVFSVYPGFVLVQIGAEQPWLEFVDFPPGEEYAWLPPIVADPDKPQEFYFPGKKLYRYVRAGNQWQPQVWSNFDFGAGEGEYLSAIEFSPLDPERVYAATNHGRLFRSDDHGVNWTPAVTSGPEPHYFYGTAVLPSRFDLDTVTVGGSGYGGETSVFRSTDGGITYEPWDEGLPETLVYCLAEAPDGSGRLFAGTETSAYMRRTDGGEWVDITGAAAPVTIYWTVEELTAENTIRFGTYGRGIWDYQLDPDHQGCYPVQDWDGDGVECDTDCADHDPAIFPGQDDPCDGVDTNCDEADPVEEDADGDGFRACAECDDADGAIHPDAEEVCGNDVDEDCSGEADPCGCSCRADGSAGVGSGTLLVAAGLLLGVLRRRR
jgi:Putative metal-binding motif